MPPSSPAPFSTASSSPAPGGAHRLILASASPARYRVLVDAGLDPEVIVSHADEDHPLDAAPAQIVAELARRKAETVATRAPSGPNLILGCDSLLQIDGELLGKPASESEVVARWRRQQGREGQLHTGHALVDTASGHWAVEASVTSVWMGHPTEQEIHAYIATGEPLRVAGGFTLDGFSAAFVDRIDGDHGTVLGLSMPVLRRLLRRLGHELTDLWRAP